MVTDILNRIVANLSPDLDSPWNSGLNGAKFGAVGGAILWLILSLK